jgi:hypothetical protein
MSLGTKCRFPLLKSLGECVALPRTLLVAGIAVVVLMAGTAAFPYQGSAMILPRAAATPDEAVRLAVESLGGSYAGVCAAARSPEDVGKICSRFVAEQGGIRAYLLGRTFSEYSSWLFVHRTAEGWTYLRIVPLALTDSLSEIPWPCDCLAPSGATGQNIAAEQLQ